MSESVDVLVIGGGVIGVCCAYYLAEQGYSPVLVERDQVCSMGGSTYGNAGMIVPSDVVPLAAPGVLGRGVRCMFDPSSPFWIMPRPSPALVRWLLLFRSACSDRHVQASMPALRRLGLSSSQLFEQLAASDGSDLSYRRKGWLTLYETADAYAEACAAQREAERVGVNAEYLGGKARATAFPG